MIIGVIGSVENELESPDSILKRTWVGAGMASSKALSMWMVLLASSHEITPGLVRLTEAYGVKES